MRPRFLVAMLAVVAVPTLAFVGYQALRPKGSGPLAYHGFLTTACQPVAEGNAVAFNDVSFKVPVPVRITGARLVDVSPGIRLVGVQVKPHRGAHTNLTDPFPVSGAKSVPADVPAGQWTDVVVGVKAEATGSTKGVVVEYESQGRSYEALYKNGFKMVIGSPRC